MTALHMSVQASMHAQTNLLYAVQVVERLVEVEPDKAAIVEQLRQQMHAEMEQHQQQLEGQALEAARQEAEARAKQQLEVGACFKSRTNRTAAKQSELGSQEQRRVGYMGVAEGKLLPVGQHLMLVAIIKPSAPCEPPLSCCCSRR